jgi:hypothetical protein
MIAVLSTAPTSRERRLTPARIAATRALARPASDPETEARTWVAAFAGGWRAPAGPDAFAAHFRPLLAPDVRLIQPQLPDLHGRDAFEHQFVRPLFALIPDVRASVERWSARDGHVYIELTLRGTIGSRPLRWRVCDRVELRDGVAVERESYFDPSPLLRAVLASPRSWPRFLSLRMRGLVKRPNRRTR